MTLGWQRLSSERPSVELGLIFLGLSAVGVGASFAVVFLWATAVGGVPFDDIIIILVLGPPLAVLGGFIYFSYREGSLSIPSLAAVIGTSVGAVFIWFNQIALYIAPPAFTFGSFLLLAAFENPKRQLPETTFGLALVSGSAVLLGATLLTGGLPWRPWSPLYTPLVLFLLLVAVILAWSGRHVYSRRMQLEV
jgi:hypothetical protein